MLTCMVKGEGVYLYDESGKKYLDVVSSWWTNLHGHAHPHIVQAIAEQAAQLEHVIFAGFTHPAAATLAERLIKHLPANQLKLFFSDNGSTAVEVAMKMAIQYWSNKGRPRNKVIAFRNGYHGDTFGAMSAGERGLFTFPFRELLFDVVFIDAPEAGYEEASSLQLQEAIDQYPEGLACFIFEPLVQGAGGMLMHRAGALDRLMAVCRKHGILTIADEVMTGFGRTGKFFACDHLTEVPDMVCMSKGLTGGFLPMAITSCTGSVFNTFLSVKDDRHRKTFYHGHSYTANPLGCAAALASLDLMESEDTMKQIQRISDRHLIFSREISLSEKLQAVRQCGTILALELKTEEGTFYHNQLRDKLYHFFMDRGILMRPLGNTCYLMPPYCISDSNLDYIYDAIKEFLNQL